MMKRKETRMIRYLSSLIVTLLLVAAAGLASAGTYTVDNAHSSISFSVSHMVISKTKGAFEDYAASFTYEPGDVDAWGADVTIQAASIDTNDDKRDEHLRSADFFDVAKFPTITFVSTEVKSTGKDSAQLTGDLTMHGVSKSVTLDVKIHGVVTDPWGNQRAGFSATGKIDRKDWGLTWNKALDSGGVVVGDDVTIEIEIEGILSK
jgi:polyisoprenoid-binding protein YceI